LVEVAVEGTVRTAHVTFICCEVVRQYCEASLLDKGESKVALRGSGVTFDLYYAKIIETPEVE